MARPEGDLQTFLGEAPSNLVRMQRGSDGRVQGGKLLQQISGGHSKPRGRLQRCRLRGRPEGRVGGITDSEVRDQPDDHEESVFARKSRLSMKLRPKSWARLVP